MLKLAIVIPAYKSMYFEQTLASIANQTCKDFTLYIGNDCSPENLKSIVDLYSDKIKIKFTQFDKNLGGENLIAQWERCIDLVDEEEWIWLFSDDDIMEPRCVEDFYKTLTENSHYDLFHFNILKIDERNNNIDNCFTYPDIYTVEEFLLGRLKRVTNSFAIEYIFRKSHFLNNNRFEIFDLAWGSDDATWIKLAKKNGIRTIGNSKVYWRESPFNISPNNWDTAIVKRKLYSQIQFAKWIFEQAKNNEIQIEVILLKRYIEIWVLDSIKQSTQFLPFRIVIKILSNFHYVLNETKTPKVEFIQIYLYKIYNILKRHIKETISEPIQFPNKRITKTLLIK